MSKVFKKSWMLRWGLNFWPPFILTGISVVELAKDYRYAKVELRLRPWNKNAVGTHFGGSIFAMTDPMYMLMLMANFYGDYVVWDKHSDIEFIKPGRGVLTAEFNITDELIAQIKHNTVDGAKYLPTLVVEVKDEVGDVVARLNRTVYIRKKRGR